MDTLNTGVKANVKKSAALAPAPTFFRHDMPLLRGALLTLGASVVFGTTLVGVSTVLLDKWRLLVAERTTQNAAARQRLAAARIEQRDLIAFQPAFAQLRRLGLVGDERRLDLMEQLKSIQQTRRLMPMSFSLAPQQKLLVDASLASANIDVRGTRLMLRLDLLHEMDLLHLLADLQGRGLYVPDTCDVKRVYSPSSAPLAPRLSAECALLWVTLAPRRQAPPLVPPAVVAAL